MQLSRAALSCFRLERSLPQSSLRVAVCRCAGVRVCGCAGVCLVRMQQAATTEWSSGLSRVRVCACVLRYGFSAIIPHGMLNSVRHGCAE